MLPLYDRNPTQRFPALTIALIVACAAAFVWELSFAAGGDELAYATMIHSGGLVPFEITSVLFARAQCLGALQPTLRRP